jgi:uncharacterized protein YbjT (DUF2867 family)
MKEYTSEVLDGRHIYAGGTPLESNYRLPFGEGKTSPVVVADVARAIAALLANPQPHIGKIYHLTGPQSENMHFYAQEYSKALGRRITYQDIPGFSRAKRSALGYFPDNCWQQAIP